MGCTLHGIAGTDVAFRADGRLKFSYLHDDDPDDIRIVGESIDERKTCGQCHEQDVASPRPGRGSPT